MNTTLMTSINEYTSTQEFYAAIKRLAKADKAKWQRIRAKYANRRNAEWLEYGIQRALASVAEKCHKAGYDGSKPAYIRVQAVVDEMAA